MQRSLLASVLFLVLAIGAGAQTSSDKPLVFEAASIKPTNSPAGGRTGPGSSLRVTTGRVFGRNVTTRRIIQQAYHLTTLQISGGPAWLDSDRLDIEAKSATPAGTDELLQMLQTLLADRFKLVVHRGTREMAVYAMVVGKNGARLLAWKDGDPMPRLPGAASGGGGRGGGGSASGGATMDRLTLQAFAEMMSNDPRVGRPVVDKTGLEGSYLIRFQWEDDESFLSAAEEATGLKFESQKAPVEFLTIDHVEKPSGN